LRIEPLTDGGSPLDGSGKPQKCGHDANVLRDNVCAA